MTRNKHPERLRAHHTSAGSPTDALFDALVDRIVDKLRPALDGRIEPRLLNLEQAAEYLGRTPDVVRKMVAAGKIPNSSGDRRILLDRKDIDAFVERCKRR